MPAAMLLLPGSAVVSRACHPHAASTSSATSRGGSDVVGRSYLERGARRGEPLACRVVGLLGLEHQRRLALFDDR
jgi:hypothetical protein